MKPRKKIAVLMGGPSAEHDISLKTAGMILKYLDREKYQTIPVKIGRDGTWPITLASLKEQTDIAFVAMHGTYGEDGQIQNTLETFGIPYTGSNPQASALAMDKEKAMKLFAENNLTVPEYFIVHKNDSASLSWKHPKHFNLPVIIKPVTSGSSLGVHLIHGWKDLSGALQNAFKYSPSVIIQKYIAGKEVSCGVLEINGNAIPLMPTEIIPGKEFFFGYESKYSLNGSRKLTPPNLPAAMIKKIQLTALETHRSLGCSGTSITDMIIDRNGAINVLELNTLPGLTETSLLFQGAQALGIGFSRLLDRIIDSAKTI